MMFYTTITGWMLSYCWYALRGDLSGLTPEQIGAFFEATLQDPYSMTGWMGLSVLIGTLVCMVGLRKGVERITKIMMACLFLVILVLVVRAVTLPGALEGIRFYLMPDIGRLLEHGVGTVVFAAMGQAFFTLSVGIGSMAIFGSYIGKERSLTGEALSILGMDTLVALLAGLVIFPACFAFGVNADSGPGLVFITLPNVFNNMPGGEFWGILFFVFMGVCGTDHRHCRDGRHHCLSHGRLGLEPAQGGLDCRGAVVCRFTSLCAGFQHMGGYSAAWRQKQHPGP